MHHSGILAFGAIALIIGSIFSLFIYFLPSFIAYTRKNINFTAILLVNLFFGWTFVGWIGCLIWSLVTLQQPQPPQVIVVNGNQRDVYDTSNQNNTSNTQVRPIDNTTINKNQVNYDSSNR